MMVEIQSATSDVRAVVHLAVADVPEMQADHLDRTIQPFRVKLTYVYRQTRAEDGWLEHDWHLLTATVTGRRILKPKADGTQRLGVDVHDAEWFTTRGELCSSFGNRSVPEWLVLVVEDVRPSGDLTLMGGVR